MDEFQPDAPDIVIVDGHHLLYHIVWPCAGSASDLPNSIKDRLGQSQPTEILVILDRYDDSSVKIMSESGVQMKGLLATISQHQARSHTPMASRRCWLFSVEMAAILNLCHIAIDIHQ